MKEYISEAAKNFNNKTQEEKASCFNNLSPYNANYELCKNINLTDILMKQKDFANFYFECDGKLGMIYTKFYSFLMIKL